ncbi:MAG: DOPA 4,5-dioxygenase family protein [Hyphomicrobiaceae bacterium]
MTKIRGYHAHVYFDAGTVAQARAVCTACRDKFGVEMGRLHQKSVGPHPEWSCQLAFGPELFGDVMGWLALNRRGLVIFAHPDTGDALADHRDHAIWMGETRRLNLSIFDRD